VGVPSRLDSVVVLSLAAVLAGCGTGARSTQTPPPPGGIQGTATFQPAYFILSLEYAPPGNESGNGYYALATTDGTIAEFTSTFAGSPTLDYDSSGDTLGTAADLGPSFAFADVNGLAASFQDTYTNTAAQDSKWSIAGAVTSTTDNVDHTQDVFFLWLNPQAVVNQTGQSSGTFAIGTPSLQNGEPEPMDIIDVSVAELSNPSLIPVGKLGPQTVNGVSGLPGLSSLCAQPAQCTPNDFATIVNFDSVIAIPSTESPLIN